MLTPAPLSLTITPLDADEHLRLGRAAAQLRADLARAAGPVAKLVALQSQVDALELEQTAAHGADHAPGDKAGFDDILRRKSAADAELNQIEAASADLRDALHIANTTAAIALKETRGDELRASFLSRFADSARPFYFSEQAAKQAGEASDGYRELCRWLDFNSKADLRAVHAIGTQLLAAIDHGIAEEPVWEFVIA